jgi:hypothetical protein
MPAGNVNLLEVAVNLATHGHGRAEANIQADLHLFLTAAPFDLGDDDLEDMTLESPLGDRRRIDVEVGFTVFEVKRDLRSGNVKADAIEQLTGYVQHRSETLGQRYVGVLTDGADWYLYQLVGESLREVSHFELSPRTPDVDGLVVWLEGVLATKQQVVPTPKVITERLGAASPSHDLDSMELRALYDSSRDIPTVRLKRELWAKLLTTAFGTNFADTDDLFVEHTLLVATAGLIGHAVVGYHLGDPSHSPATLMSGQAFANAQIFGVVEEDFFAWVIEIPDGLAFVRSLARRLSRFDWQQVDHDVMKVLYESVISADERHRLGEYYTPDWLADQMVSHIITDPLHQRVLDPGCGSGTFLFWAVRHYLDAAEAAGIPLADAVHGVTGAVMGLDIHPVACTLARVTYLLAIGTERLQDRTRPPFSVPVYLGDSVQWGQQRRLLTAGSLAIDTNKDGGQAAFFTTDLLFPERLLEDAGRFDELVSELADKAATRRPGAKPPSLTATFRRFAIHPGEEEQLTATFKAMCELHDQGRNHIWGYYTRNLARPVWLSRDDHRVDVLVGNPPWLAYRYMTPGMQTEFRTLCQERRLWHGAGVATHQDLSALFVARCAQLYLKNDGRFGFVMPLAALSRRQFRGFRDGNFHAPWEPIVVEFDQPWDLHRVKPSFFPVPGCVVFGTKRVQRDISKRALGREATLADVVRPSPLAGPPDEWSGRLPQPNMTWAQAAPLITRSVSDHAHREGQKARSPYAARFAQGATFVPRFLLLVEPVRSTPLGAGAGRIAVRSIRSPNEKKPWKNLPTLSRPVESQFIRPLILGETILPYIVKPNPLAIVPWDGEQLLGPDGERIDLYPGLAAWWREASTIWDRHGRQQMTLNARLDYRHGLSHQFPIAHERVVYTKGGMYLAAARITDPQAVIDHKLYWAPARSKNEALYLTGILNSDALTLAVRPLQARGEHNPRDFDKYIFQLPVPLFDRDNEDHLILAELADAAEKRVAAMQLPELSFQAQRKRVRQALRDDGIAEQVEAKVAKLLDLA